MVTMPTETRPTAATESNARRRLVASAVELIRRRGVAGTTVSALLEHSGAARRSLYLHFPEGRDELLAAAVAQAGAAMTAGLSGAWRGADPRAALDAFIDAVADGVEARGARAGCPIVAAALGGEDVPAVREQAVATFAAWRSELAKALRRSGFGQAHAVRLATTVVAAVEGALIIAVAEGKRTALDQVAVELRVLLGPPASEQVG